MRDWTNPRVVAVALILIGAPLATLGQLAFSWYPQTRRVARLNDDVETCGRALADECAAVEQLRVRVTDVERHAAESARENARRWLAARDRDAVFDRVAAAVQSNDVAIEELASGEPRFFGGTSQRHVLAAESISVRCTGTYAALTEALDRIATLTIPPTFAEIVWERTPTGLALRFVALTPFVPNDELRESLAVSAGLPKESHER